jgi:PAS domain S-box-containing protein
MAKLVEQTDWSSTPLGNPATWSPTLKFSVNMILSNGFPMAVRWGPDFVMIYNDGYRPILGEKHPLALGKPFRDVWPEVQSQLGPLHEDILSGRRGALFAEDLLLRIQRHGDKWEDARFTVSYSPIPDDSASSGIGGVLITAVETTERVQLENALARKTEELALSETRYRSALIAGRMGNWETDYVAKTRSWSQEGMKLFGLKLAAGNGRVGGEADEFRSALHPDDRHLVEEFQKLADTQDSFLAEYRVVLPDGSIRWLSGRGQVVARGADGKAQRLVSIVGDITERKTTEDHVRLLMRELAHRSKNLLAVVHAISVQTGRTALNVDEFNARFILRLKGLAASHDLLIDQNWQGAPLDQLVRDQLAPFVEAGSARLEIEGPHVLLSPEAAQAIGLALHELATNAVKHGSLSVPAGRTAISWELENSGAFPRQLRLRWTERGGPAVKLPSHKGFGHVVFERIVSASLKGKVVMDFDPQGLNWELTIPVENLLPEGALVAKPSTP